MSKFHPIPEQELKSIIFLQDNLINLCHDNYESTEIALLNSVWGLKPEFIPQLIHNIIVTSVYRPYSNGLLAKLIVSMSKVIDASSNFTSLLITSILDSVLQRAYTPLRGSTMSLLMYLVFENFVTINDVTKAVKKYKKVFFEQICFNVFVWLAPEIEANDPDFFKQAMKICESWKENIDSLYPTVSRFLYDLPKLMDNDWENLKMRRNATVKIFSSILKRNDIESLIKLSFHPQFNPAQKIAQSIYENSFVVSNSPTLCEFAAFCGAIDCFEFLMQHGADPEDTDMFGKKIEEFAVCGGCTEIIAQLNENGMDCSPYMHLNARFFHDTDDLPPSEKLLIAAAYSNNVKVVNECLKKGVNVDAHEENNKKTPLVIATQFGHMDTIRLLLEKGANINHQDSDGLSPLQHACQNGYADIVALLLSFDNIDIQSKHKFDMTSLHWACQKGFANIVQMLLATNKADINSRDDENWTPLHWAVQNGHNDILEILLKLPNIDVNVHQKDEMTPLHFAATTGNLQALILLLGYSKTIVDPVDNGGLTPLHWACQNGKNEIIDYIVTKDKRADVNKTDDEKWTPLHWAAQNDHDKAISILSKSDKTDFNIKEAQGMTPLLVAALNSSSNAMKVLCSIEKVDLEAKDRTGKTALHLIARNGHLPSLKILISNPRINVNSTQDNGMTPLHLAVANNKAKVVKLLASVKGIDVHKKDKEGTTPLDAAKILGYSEIENILKNL